MARIAPYLFANRKMCMALETTYGTNVIGTSAAANAVRIIEGNSVPVAGAMAKYSVPRGINVAVPQSRKMLLHRKLAIKLPFYVPSSASNMAAVIAYYTKLLCSSGFDMASITSEGGVPTPTKIFTPSLNYVISPSVADNSCTVYDYRTESEHWETTGARGNVKLAFATDGENPCVLDLDWLGLCTAATPTSYLQADFSASDIGALPIFTEAQHIIYPYGEAVATDWLACKGYEYDAGMETKLCNDCNAVSGVGAIHAKRNPDNQKVSFDCEAPLGHALWPYVQRWRDGILLYSILTLIGGVDANAYYGVTIENLFQMTDEPDVTDDGGYGRIKISGTCCSPLAAPSALVPSMKITVGTVAAVTPI